MKDTIIESDLSLDEQYELVCKELKEGRHNRVLPVCFQMGHNHTISSDSKLTDNSTNKE